MVQQFFGSGSYSIIGPYMAEIWPSRLGGSGMGLVYGVGNLGKFIGPAGLALIAGSSNFVSPQATVDARIPAMNYFALWYVIGLLAALFITFESELTKDWQTLDRSAHPNRVTRTWPAALLAKDLVGPLD